MLFRIQPVHPTPLNFNALIFSFLYFLLVWKKAVSLLNLLHHWITSYPSSAIDKDLLLDASLLVWDVSSDVFTGPIVSTTTHDQSTCKQMLDTTLK